VGQYLLAIGNENNKDRGS